MGIKENVEASAQVTANASGEATVTPKHWIASLAWPRSDALFVGIVIGVVLLVTSLPFIYAYATEPAGKQFMGIMLDVPDHAQYFSWMRELTTEHLAANKMTPEANRPLFFNLLWWGMGRIGKLLGWGYAGMFQVLRVLATISFLALLFRVCQWFLKDQHKTRVAFLLATFTSGFGWVLVVIKYLSGNELLFPLDVYIAEGNTFLGILGYPHFIAAALYIFVFDLLLRGQAKGQLRYSVWAGLFALFLGWQHAYDLVSIYGVWLAYAVLLTLRDRRLPVYAIQSGVILGLISCWPAIYSVALTSLDPIWEEVLKQFANAGVYTPNLLHLPILLGAGFLLAIYTVIRDHPLRLREVSDADLFLRGWFLITFVLVYLPVDYQIHLLNGWQVPFAILATMGLYRYIIPWIHQRINRSRPGVSLQAVTRWAAAGLILVVLPTNVYLWAWRFIDLGRHTYPYYLHDEELAAMQWLEQNAAPEDVVFSSLTIGQYIPAWTGTHAYLAHWAQTVDFYTKSSNVERFFAGDLTPVERQEVLNGGSVDYVFFGPAESEFGASPPQMELLNPVYQNSLVTVYRVTE